MLKRVLWVGMLAVTLGAVDGLAAEEKAVNFEGAEIGKLPAGFTTVLSGKGKEGAWAIENDPTAPAGAKVLVQTDKDETSARYPLCLLEGLKAADVEASVRFKAISGNIDQAAGLVVRCLDKDHYYVVRANAAEDNVRLYHFIDGKRTQFAGKDVEVPPGQWHTLKIKVTGKHFTVSLNGKDLFEADDETLKGAGQVGLWTKADSVTRFDDLRITPQDGK